MGNIARLLLLGVAFHALCILSIFDIYFQSPVESSIPSNEYTLTPPAKRVIIFTLDGCRVDKLFKAVAGHADRYDLNAESASTSTKFASNRRTPYLGDVMRNRGSWGVSHNHAPTESRPCHVALTAGMYEDPHAVTKNWKQHPVPFDSVFNQSSSAFIYGNKDVAPMLARHAPQATEEHYTAKEEVDMVREDTTLLDVWAYEKMKDLFARGAEAKDPDLYKKLHQDKLVIYCHYLGTDLTGPKFGADSREYLENIAVVDELIEKTEKMIDAYFGNDRRTAYVLNSDHGMDLRGDHGDKDPSKTRTAIIAWGAGIHRPVVVNRTGDEGFDFDVPTQSKAEVQVRLESQETEEQVAAQEWRTLIHFKRKDVMQIDVAPLISALAGLPYPRNSVGVLPFTYLTKNKYRVNAMRANAQQLYQHALRKEEVKHANRGLLFIPYAPLHSRVPDLMAHIDEALNSIPASDGESHAIHNEAHHVIEKLIQEMIDICRNAIIYYQRYDWLFLLGSVILSYVGWALTMTVAYLQPQKFRVSWLLVHMIDVKFVAAVIVVMWWRFFANSPSTYYLYGLCPLILWNFVWNYRDKLQAALPLAQDFGWQQSVEIAAIFLCLEQVVLGYQHRAIFSLLFLLLALRPRIAVGHVREPTRGLYQRDGGRKLTSPTFWWSASCLLIAIFPCLPSDYDESIVLVHIGALLTLVFAFVVLRGISTRQHVSRDVLKIGVPPVLMAQLTLQWTTNILSSQDTLPFFLAAANWALVMTPPICLLVQTKWLSNKMQLPSFKAEKESNVENPQPGGDVMRSITVRLVKVVLAFEPAFVLLSTAHEVLFYAALCSALVIWLMLEGKRSDITGGSGRREVQRALMFLLLSQISFFGTSSVASMTRFQISSTRRFLTGSTSSTVQALVVLKLLIPFVVVACAFRLILLLPAVSARGKEQQAKPAGVSRYLLLAVSMADVLAVQYLFLVNSEGSWKQMGNSIAEFCIVNAQIVLLPTLVIIAWLFVHDLESVDKEYDLVDTVGDDKVR